MSDSTPAEPSARTAPGDGSAPARGSVPPDGSAPARGSSLPDGTASSDGSATGDGGARAEVQAPVAPARLQPPTAPPAAPTTQASTADAAVATPSSADAGTGVAAIATWSAPNPRVDGQVPLSTRTGEPTRVATIWIATTASYLATAVTGAATLWIYWDAVRRFPQASWLMGQFVTEPGSLARVLLAVAVTAIAILIGAATAITGYYAYDGRRWTRWSALVAFAVSLLALLLNPLAWAAPGLAAIAAVAVWLPPSVRYFATWQALRRHDPVFSPPPTDVAYGPLPRYR